MESPKNEGLSPSDDDLELGRFWRWVVKEDSDYPKLAMFITAIILTYVVGEKFAKDFKSKGGMFIAFASFTFFVTALALAPNDVYRSQKVSKAIGTKNVLIARAVCIVPAVACWSLIVYSVMH